MNPANDRIRLLSLFLQGITALALLTFIATYGVNIPWGDEWDALLTVDKFYSSGLNLEELFKFHNEHRIPVIRLLMMANLLLFSLNLKLQMYLVGISLIALSVICIINHLKVCQKQFAWLALMSPLLLCNFRHMENLLWAFQIGFVLSIVLPVVSLHIMTRKEGNGAMMGLVALICAIIASYSSSQGLFVWPAGLLALLFTKDRIKTTISIWVTVGVAVWSSYFIGFSPVGGHPPLDFVLSNPKEALIYFGSLIGNLVPWSVTVSSIFGLVAFALFAAVAVAIVKRRAFEFSFWIATGVFCLMVLIAISIGRSGFGVETAFSSRYAFISALFLIALLALYSGWLQRIVSLLPAIPLYAVAVILLIAVPFSNLFGLRGGRHQSTQLQQMRVFLKNYRIAPEGSMRYLFFPNSAVPKERAPILQKIGHEIFSAGRGN